MSCRTEARVERNTARASPFSTCVPRTATATRLLNRVLGVYGYSGFRRESKIHEKLTINGLRGALGWAVIRRHCASPSRLRGNVVGARIRRSFRSAGKTDRQSKRLKSSY